MLNLQNLIQLSPRHGGAPPPDNNHQNEVDNNSDSDDEALHFNRLPKPKNLSRVIQRRDGHRLSAKKSRNERFIYKARDLKVPKSYPFQTVQKPAENLNHNQLLLKNLMQMSGGLDHDRREHGANLVAMLHDNITTLKNTRFEHAMSESWDAATNTKTITPVPGNLTDHLMAYCGKNREFAERLKESEMTNEGLQTVVKQNFAIVKQSDPKSLGSNCLKGIMHCASAQLLTIDVVWRVLEEVWPNINHHVPVAAARTLGACRDLHEQIVDINHVLLSYEDNQEYQHFVDTITKLLPLKRRSYTKPSSFGVHSMVQGMRLKTSAKRKFRDVSDTSSNFGKTNKRVKTTHPAGAADFFRQKFPLGKKP